MSNKSYFSVEVAVVNQSGAMEADTISKNGRSLKSQMSRRNFLNYFVIAALAVAAAFTSCGGSGGSSSSKGLNGTYVGNVRGTKVSYNFSGNKIKGEAEGQDEKIEGIYELVEEYKEDDFSRGKLIITDRNGKNETEYQLEGRIFSFNGQSYIKNGKSSKIPDGNYYINNNDREYYVFSGNNLKIVNGSSIQEATYEFVVGYENKGISKGYILMKSENGTGAIHCVLEKDKLILRGVQTLTKR